MVVPEAFPKVVMEFIADLLSTFPELKETLHPALLAVHEGAALDAPCFQEVFDHVIAFDPKTAFCILTENPSLFASECVLLPGINFETVWKENITAQTQASIWKYLKLMTMAAVGTDDGAGLRETMEAATKGVQDFFGEKGNMPDPVGMEEQFKSLAESKLGCLAKEIADETVSSSSQEDMENMMKNPTKLFDLVHTVGDKIEQRLKSGQLKESELLEEASSMFTKFKDMPMFEQMMKNFTGGAGGKMDVGAMHTKMQQSTKAAQMRERMKRKLEKRKKGETPA